jgi:WD40 repeat protein
MPVKAPSRVEPLSFPVFGISWYADPIDGTSILAYCGGGGSARTGVNNSIIVQYNGSDSDNNKPQRINTDDDVGIALHVYQNQATKKLWLVVGMQNYVQRYSLPDGEPAGKIELGDSPELVQGMNGWNVSSLAVNSTADLIAIGCEDGSVKVFYMNDDYFDAQEDARAFQFKHHVKAVCSMAFSLRHNRLITSAKDGTANVYQDDKLVETLECSVLEKNEPPPIRPVQVLVRGCAFLDMDGTVAVAVASGRRGKAFLFQWVRKDNQSPFTFINRTVCNPIPISAMSLSQDASLLALGSVDGSVVLWGVPNWKLLKKFPEVHELPVTCIAVRPYPVELRGESDGVQIHARSCSADSKLGCLTLQKRRPRKAGDGLSGVGFLSVVHRMVLLAVFVMFLKPIWNETRDKCGQTIGWADRKKCFMENVLIAPAGRPGVSVPPY